MKTLKDKAIVITGAGGSIAGAVESLLAAEGAKPILVDRDLIRIRARARSYDTRAVEEDLLTRESAERAAAAAIERMGRIDGLVHLVGEVVPGRLEDVDDEAYARAFDSNVRSLFHAVRAFLPHLKAVDEAFLAAIGGQRAFHDGAAGGATLFAAAKGAATSLLRSLDVELSDTNVDVAVVTPVGPVSTDTMRRLLGEAPPQGWITPDAVARAFRAAALAGEGGRLLELAVHPPRRRAG